MNFLKIQNKLKSYQTRLYSRLLKGSAGHWGKNTKIHPPFHSNNIRQLFLGANSVITKDIPEYCVAAGIPAKIIKRYNKDKNEWGKC